MALDKSLLKDYYGKEAGWKYQSASQFKAMQKCSAEVMAELRGEYKPETSPALFDGQCMDTWFEGEKETEAFEFVNYTKIYTKQGTRRANIQKAYEAFLRAKQDPVFMEYMAGEHQPIFTGEIAGVPFKGKLDSYFEGPNGKIVDLKYMKDMEPGWVHGKKVPFCDVYGYPLQLAIYRELVKQNTGYELPCYLAVITKETVPRIEIVEIPSWKLDSELEIVKHYAPIYQQIKEGKIEPTRCEACEYCRQTHKITAPIKYEELMIA